MSETDDWRIVESVLGGDKEAFGILVRRHQKAVYNLMRRMCGANEDAADLTQETFIKAYSKLNQFQSGRDFFPWVYAIGMNTARDWARRRKAADVLTDRDLDRDYGRADPDEYQDRLNLRLDNRRLAAALRSLPLEYREAVVLRYQAERSMSEIAESLGISVSGAKMRVHRGLRKLRRILEESFDER